MEDLSRQYSYIDEQYEASEKLIADSRTGLDNECEMNAMTLENKVYFLQTQPKPVRDRIQKQLNCRARPHRADECIGGRFDANRVSAAVGAASA